jgi:phospholipid/cholesterol/gamma-HCH transport system ATP-binding protein
MTESAASDQAHVRFTGVDMAFGDRTVLERLSCAFPRGGLSVILGGSGSGKSTMLRLIGGLIRPRAGAVEVDGTDVTRLSEQALYQVRKKIGMMFQGGALLDSLTVYENLALPLREHTSMTERAIQRAVHEQLEAVGLSEVDDLLPGQLSGGMVKRVAVARAIIMKPVILLCDEPFSGLDPISAKRIETLLVDINRDLRITVVLVSHSIASTMRIADHVVVLLPEGILEGSARGAAEGTPGELQRSTDPRVAAFLRDDFGEGPARADAARDEAPASTGAGA